MLAFPIPITVYHHVQLMNTSMLAIIVQSATLVAQVVSLLGLAACVMTMNAPNVLLLTHVTFV